MLKRKILKLISLVLVPLILICYAPSALFMNTHAVGTNLITTNSGFEDGVIDTNVIRMTTNYSVVTGSAGAKTNTGTHSAYCPATSISSGVRFIVNVSANTNYVATLWKKTTAHINGYTGGVFRILAADAVTYITSMSASDEDNQWHEYQLSFNSGSNTTISVSFVGGGEETYLDDYRLTTAASAPVATGSAFTTGKNIAYNGTASATGSGTLSYSLVSNAAHGSAVMNTDGSYTYFPSLDYVGTDSFTFKASNGSYSNIATVTATVTLNDPANPNLITTNAGFEDGAINTNVIKMTTNYSVITGTAGTTTHTGTHSSFAPATTGAAGGVRMIVTVTPNTNYVASVWKKTTVHVDGYNGGLFRILASDAVTTITSVSTSYEDNQWHEYLLTFNSGSNTSISVSYAGGGEETYLDDYGLVVNPAPKSINSSFATDKNYCYNGSVTATGNGTITYSKGTNPTHGTLTFSSTGNYTYTPAIDYVGTDSFTFKANNGLDSNTATVSISVTDGGTTNPNLITTNSGFEDGAINTGVIKLTSNFSVITGTSGTTTYSGTHSVYSPATTSSSSGVRMIVTVTPNTDYVATIWKKTTAHINGYNGGLFRILAADAVTTITSVSTTHEDNQWHQYQLTFNSGSNTSVSVSYVGGGEETYVDNYSLKLWKLTQTMIDRSVVNDGDKSRIANAMKKAQRGEPITVGFIGGSITEGAGASPSTNKYASLVSNWWTAKFPSSQITFVNAGIGSTTSVLGVHRVQKDLLYANPDFVVVDFAVNDTVGTDYQTAYEDLVKRILLSTNNPGVLMLFMTNNVGVSQQIPQTAIGNFYDLPMISYKDAIWPEVQNGNINWADVGADYIHPNNHGHAVVAGLIDNYLDGVYTGLSGITEQTNAVPSAFLTSNLYMNGMIYDNTTITPTSFGGFVINNSALPSHFPYGWSADGNVAPMVFNVSGAKVVHVLYKKSINGLTGKALVTAVGTGGQLSQTVDGDFPGGFGDYPVLCKAWDSSTSGSVQLSIQLQINGTKDEFTVLGILVS